MITTVQRSVLIAVLVFTRALAVDAQVTSDSAFKRIAAEYARLGPTPGVGPLVRLDRQLRVAVKAMNDGAMAAYSKEPPARPPRLSREYDDIGVGVNAFNDDVVEYGGKLLAEAHAANPNSEWRGSTLYSTLSTTMPDSADPVSIRPLRAYLREFPRGPFAPDATLYLARFYADLYKMVRDSVSGPGKMVEYKVGCFLAYFTQAPLRDQMRIARDSGIRVFERAIAMMPADTALREVLADFRKGEYDQWWFCPD